ncbi:MAG TPA: prepilin peptidase [Gaiellaceae bacterium]|nr:prepilin peptidase [Gaiellaceae bacterium]
MNAAAAALALAPALALGSFLNVVAARVPLRRSIVSPGSACPACGHAIAWRDNVPVLSWLLLRGRCRHCRSPISPLYPLVEAATAALVAACIAAFGPTGEGLLAAGFCALLVVLSAIDLEHRIVPNRIVLPAAALALVAHMLLEPSPEWLLAALAAGGALFVVVLAYPNGLGMGDVKLALLLGAILGRSVTVALLLGLLAALVPAAILAVRHGRAARRMSVPLVPFLALGSVVALFAGDRLLDAYLGLF